LSHQVLAVGERKPLLKLELQECHQVDTPAVGCHDLA
jgi:hypothetical protein